MENTGSGVYPEKQEQQENVGQGIPVEQNAIQNQQVIVVHTAGQALRKCDWNRCYFATFSRCDYKWCCRRGCGKNFCLDHKGHMIRIGDNQDYSTAVCVECAPGFWKAVVKCQLIPIGLAVFIVLGEMIFWLIWIATGNAGDGDE